MSERLEMTSAADASPPIEPTVRKAPRRLGLHLLRRAVGNAKASAVSRFGRGEAETIAAASALVSRVVQYRAYYIPHDERPDLIQDTMLDVLRGIPRGHFASDAEFFGFVRTVAHRRCVDWVRRQRRQNQLSPRASQLVDPGAQLLAKERCNLACEVVSRLKEPCRNLFALHVSGMTYGELADRYGRSEGAVRTQAYECLKLARRLLDRLSRRQVIRPVGSGT